MTPKYIFVTGGVLSSLGKGLASACIGALLEARGLSVILQKLDPYVNVDPGTMNPFQHGEVFVTDDGAETDLDLGHYERFTNARLTKACNHTTGSIYNSVITKERRGDYLGGTVQIIPHVTDEIKKSVVGAVNGVDLAIVEIGGTVGDIEGLPFLEAIRQFRADVGKENVLYIHLTLVPYIKNLRRTQDQAHPALGERTKARGYPAGYPALPHGKAPGQKPQGKDRPFLQRGARGGDHRGGRGRHLRGAASFPRAGPG